VTILLSEIISIQPIFIQLQGGEALLQKLNWSFKPPPTMEPQGSLQYSQGPATGPYSKVAETTPQPHTLHLSSPNTTSL
jgi:hypothetical protein